MTIAAIREHIEAAMQDSTFNDERADDMAQIGAAHAATEVGADEVITPTTWDDLRACCCPQGIALVLALTASAWLFGYGAVQLVKAAIPLVLHIFYGGTL
jgi:hypothetical protein